MKHCPKCKKTKEINDFYADCRAKDGLQGHCKLCKQKYAKQHYKRNKTERRKQVTEYNRQKRDSYYLSKYGITLVQYNRMLQEQEHCCAICNRHESLFKKRLTVDHEHTTGTVRKLLCSDCNVGLGLFRDDPMIVAKAVQYLTNTFDTK